jgi:hypothetical protein
MSGDNRDSRPRPYDLSKPEEIARLFREVHGYLHVSLHHGTDLEGRQYALDALAVLASAKDLTFEVEIGRP